MALDPGTMLYFVRFLFAFTIGSHILLVSTSIALALLISVAEFISIRRRDAEYEALARRLSKIFVISFGVGTASGIVMAVELVTLFPSFMTLVASTGAIALFYAEVFAFFLESLALVLYVYYWNAFRRRYAHWIASVFIVAGTLASAVFITMVNSWMNTPVGFDTAAYISSGFKTVTGVQPYAAFLTPSTVDQVFHVLAATIFAGSMVVGAYFAYWYLRSGNGPERGMYRKALKILAPVAVVTIILSGLSGSKEMASLLVNQPLKYAALEANLAPGINLPDRFFGLIINGNYVGGVSFQGMQAFLAQLETGTTVLPGLSQFPSGNWPPLFVSLTFNVMTAGGVLLGLFFLALFASSLLRRRPLESKIFLYGWIPVAMLAMVVYELGWATDEIGRQPWIVYNVLTVAQAANTSGDLLIPGLAVVAFYIVIVPVTFYLYARVFRQSHSEGVVA